MKKINISFQVDSEKHLEIKNIAKSQNKTLPTYFLDLHNNFIHGREMSDPDELLRKILIEARKRGLIQSSIQTATLGLVIFLFILAFLRATLG